jgi:acyl-CoA hydrolase
VTSINSALQIDLSGQVCADSIGHRIYSGVGGQVDFVLGATWSQNGKSIIAMPSTARDGALSRLVTSLAAGAGVVTTRAQVDYVVTEYGVAELRGRSLGERARDLIAIAHPDFREGLAREARDELKLSLPG